MTDDASPASPERFLAEKLEMTSLTNPLNRRRLSLAIGGIFAASVAVSVPATDAHAQDNDLTTLADQLIKLRGEVETLHDDIESRQQQHRNRMASLSQRRSELEAQIQRQELALKKIEREVGELRSKAKTIDEESAALRPVVKTVTQLMESYVDNSLPFTIAERKSELQQIPGKLERGELTTPRAINQMWTFVEDELRLCRENGIFRQTITIDGEEQLADVIRLGMTMLFFRSGDGDVGRAVKTNDAWTFQTLAGDPAQKTDNLFDEFERQVRTGYFTIPNALPGEKQ